MVVEQGHGGRCMEQQLRAQILIHKQEAKRDIGNGASLLKPQSLPPVSDTPSPTKPHLPNPSQSVPPTRNQVFHCMSLHLCLLTTPSRGDVSKTTVGSGSLYRSRAEENSSHLAPSCE